MNLINKIKNINPQVAYLIINIAISFVGFLKSFVYMKYFGFFELGIIVLLNTTIMLVSLFQLGLLNGGYRIFSLASSKDNDKVNNTINTYFLILSGLLLLFVIVSYILGIEVNPIYLIVGGVTGIATLSKNWITNMLIAKSRLTELNRINVSTNALSLLFLLLIPYLKLIGAVMSIMAPAFLFIVVAFVKFKDLRPTGVTFKIYDIKYILISGFIPFVAGILEQVNIQVQNWSITSVLSEEYLGRFYLASLYLILFMMMPKALNNLFFPKAMNYYDQKDYRRLNKHLKKYYLVLLLYTIPVVLLTFFMMEPIIKWIFPEHIIGIKYVYMILPGLIATLFAAPIGLIYNASIKMKPMLLAYIFSALINIIVVFILWKTSTFNLENISILKSALGVFIFVFFYISYLFMKKKIWVK